MTKSAATSVRTARKAAAGFPAATAQKVIAKAARKPAVMRPAPHAADARWTSSPAKRPGMDYYFMRALRQVDVGFVAEQTARVGMSGAVTLVNSMSRKYIVRMGSAQLLVVARHIRELG